ncbi:MAG: hypothetical protein A2Y24_01925 [Clostridiales bacterium GWE2_32_10]|nr:MAG: hypothetical protein A2Y24_01925 [Clostridiales bacterium GWE2_32_10]HBY19840.1 hypothetical protein [Clostridiales bacterium]
MENIFVKDPLMSGLTDEELSCVDLPSEYKELLKIQDGGFLRNNHFRAKSGDIYVFSHLFGLKHNHLIIAMDIGLFEYSLAFCEESDGLVVISKTEWDETIYLDYRENKVIPAVLIPAVSYKGDQRYDIIKIAGSFSEFINGLYRNLELVKFDVTSFFDSIDDNIIKNINACFNSNLSHKVIPVNQDLSIDIIDGFSNDGYKMFLGDNLQTHSKDEHVKFYLELSAILLIKRDSVYQGINKLRVLYDIQVFDTED